MTKIAILLAVVVGTAAPAAAQPECAVVVAHAPDDVRAVVEAWVRAEPRCVVSLEVRIVPTDGGYYLYARDFEGHVRERIVPDAQTAGVLIASWAANDRTSAPAVALGDERLAPATVAPGVLAPVIAAAPPEGPRRWLSLGLFTSSGGPGVRGELDLVTWGRWAIGIGASFNRLQDAVVSDTVFVGFDVRYWKALAYVAPTFRLGRWHAQPSIALGLVLATADVQQLVPTSSSYDLTTSYPTAQGALLLGRYIGDNWSIQAGPIATLAMSRVGYGEMDEIAILRDQIAPEELTVRDPALLIYLGVQRRLW